MYHKGPFHVAVKSISGQRWNDILCHLWGIKGTLWVKGSQVLKWPETGRLLVWNLNPNPIPKQNYSQHPCLTEVSPGCWRQMECQLLHSPWEPGPKVTVLASRPVLTEPEAREGPWAWKLGKNKWTTRFSGNACWAKPRWWVLPRLYFCSNVFSSGTHYALSPCPLLIFFV